MARGDGNSPCPFIGDPRPTCAQKKKNNKKTQLGTADRRKNSHSGDLTLEPLRFTTRATPTCMAPSLFYHTMNPAQPGSPSQDAKLQLHQMEESAEGAESDELQPKDMTTDKGYKLQRSSLPFSVESLISKKSTCRTSYPAFDSAPTTPTPGAGQGAQFSPRTFYAERKLSGESSQGVAKSSGEDCAQFCEKEQSTWFQTSSLSTPHRKSVPSAL